MEQERRLAQRCETADGEAVGALAVLAAFGVGLVAGAAAALLTTPESGSAVRRRLQRGADAARREFDGVLHDTRASWDGLRAEARDAVKRTTSRIKEAAEVTKAAVLNEGAPNPADSQ